MGRNPVGISKKSEQGESSRNQFTVDLMTPNGSHGEAVCLYKVGLEWAKVFLTSFIEE